MWQLGENIERGRKGVFLEEEFYSKIDARA